jgi:hypothetical protein
MAEAIFVGEVGVPFEVHVVDENGDDVDVSLATHRSITFCFEDAEVVKGGDAPNQLSMVVGDTSRFEYKSEVAPDNILVAARVGRFAWRSQVTTAGGDVIKAGPFLDYLYSDSCT